MIIRDFNDTDIATTRRSILSWVSLYAFFVFFGGFHLRPNGFFETISGKPLTFAAPVVLWIIATILIILGARLYLLGEETWYSKDRFKLGGPGGPSNKSQEFFQKLSDLHHAVENAVNNVARLSDDLNKLSTLDFLEDFSSELSEIMQSLRNALRTGPGGDPPRELEFDLSGVLLTTREFVQSKRDAVNSLSEFGGNLGNFSQGLQPWSQKPMQAELTEFLEMMRSDQMKARRSRKISFLVFETGLPLALVLISVLHSAWRIGVEVCNVAC